MALFPRSDSAPLEARLETLPQRLRTTLTSAQLQHLKAEPFTLLGPPGPASWLLLTEYTATFHAGADPFTTVYDLHLLTGDGSTEEWGRLSAAGFLDQTTDQCAGNALGGGGTIGATASLTNQPITLANTGAGEIAGNAAGDASLTLDLYYRIHPA